jgi:Histidine kinase-, DNA gyrase B-, and HSP90-like ATPase.
MNFFGLSLIQFFGYMINGIGILYVLHVLWERNFRLTKRFLSYPIFCAMLSILIAIVSLPYLETGFDAGTEMLTEIFKFCALILYYMYLFKSKDLEKIFPSITISIALENIFSLLFRWIMTEHMAIHSIIVYYFLHLVFICLSVILFMHLISKTKIINYFRGLLKVGFISLSITGIYLITVFGGIYYARKSGTEIYMVVGAIIYISSFLFLGLISRDFYIKGELQQSKALLLQQQLYVGKLENIQQELRMFQHDYKNMVFGLYAQADEGNTEAIKEHISKKLLNVDDEIQQDIRQTNQFSQIANMELKGLLLVKALEAKSFDVQMDLEVLNKVEKINIDANDLVRCIGILVDNAIEAAKKTITKNVVVVIFQEEHQTTIIVKNDILDSVDISNIWQPGYSTKGENRGIGLSNYKKILSGYDNVFCGNKLENQQFIQIIVVT